jgi:flagellar assembly factor FliW
MTVTARPATRVRTRVPRLGRNHEVMTDTSDIPVIEFVRPIPGFPDSRRFALVQVDDSGLLSTLRSLDEPDVSFVVVPPAGFFPDYAPAVDDATAAELGITRSEDVLLLVVLNVGESLEGTTANLLAPILVTHDRRACQVVLDDEAHPVDAPLVA